MASVVLSSGQRWELGEQIGKGGAGQVYVATCGASGPHVIKLVPRDVPGVQREAFIGIGLLNQPNVLPVLDTGKTDTHLALLMRRAEKSLRQYMSQTQEAMPEADALPILIDVARGLVSLTRARVPWQDAPGVVHRDLKPENVLLLDGAWCLSDFGIARALNNGTARDTRRYFMTHEYAAPEQWRGETAIVKTDVYAFGIIAYELLMGKLPFNGPEFRQQHLDSEIPAMRGVSPRLATIIAECLYKPAGTRPSPDRLVRRLEDERDRIGSERVAPVTRGLSALQSANFAEAGRRGQVERDEQRKREHAAQRAELLRIALSQLHKVKSRLKNVILENAPSCTASPGAGGRGWNLKLNKGWIEFSGHSEREQYIGSHAPPFEIISYSMIAVGILSPAKLHHETWSNKTYFANELWFCDPRRDGRYFWYELSDRARWLPIPWEELSQTPLMMEDLDNFVDRWATLFADAALGNLPVEPEVRTPIMHLQAEPVPEYESLSVRAAQYHALQQAADSAEQVDQVDDSITSPIPEIPMAPAERAIVNWVEKTQASISPHHAEVEAVLRELEYQSGYGEFGSVEIASELSIAQREAVCRELRTRLQVDRSPALVLRYASDKKRSFGTEGVLGRVLAFRRPLQFLDGTPYIELVYASTRDPRKALAERREPGQGQGGRLLCAFLITSSEASGALSQGRPSRSLRSWLDGPEMTLPSNTSRPTPF